MLQGAKRFIDCKLFAHCIWQPKKTKQWDSFKTSQGHYHILLHIWTSCSLSSPDVHIPILLLRIWLSLLMSFTTHSFDRDVILLRFEIQDEIWSNWSGQNYAWNIVSLRSHMYTILIPTCKFIALSISTYREPRDKSIQVCILQNRLIITGYLGTVCVTLH